MADRSGPGPALEQSPRRSVRPALVAAISSSSPSFFRRRRDAQQHVLVELHRGVGVIVARRVRRLSAPARDGGERGARDLGAGAGVVAAEEAVADEAEAETHPFRAPATRPRTTYFCSSRTNRSVGSKPSRQMAIMSVKNTK